VSRFDEIYAQGPDHFGTEPSKILGRFHGLIRPGGRVLDIGVGQGRNAIFLARLGFEVDGIDTSEVGLAAVRETASEEDLPIELHHGDAMTFSPGRAYDAVLALGIIPLLGHDDVDLLFDRIDGWTAPGGLVYVSAFTVQDKRYGESHESWEGLGRNTFQSGRRRGTVRSTTGRASPGNTATATPHRNGTTWPTWSRASPSRQNEPTDEREARRTKGTGILMKRGAPRHTRRPSAISYRVRLPTRRSSPSLPRPARTR